MEKRGASVFDTCLEQALHGAEQLMTSMVDAAIEAVKAQMLSPSNTQVESLLRQAQMRLQSKRESLALVYALYLRQAAYRVAHGDRGTSGSENRHLAGIDGQLESEVLKAQIEWGRLQIDLLQQTEQSLLELEGVYRPLYKITQFWRHGNPLHYTVYLDSLQLSLADQAMPHVEVGLYLPAMVQVISAHLQDNYRKITGLALNSYGDLLAKAALKKKEAKTSILTFASKAKRLFHLPSHCPVGAVKAYKALLPVMERLADTDSSLWADAEHPARVLVQGIIDKSIALKQGYLEPDPQFPQAVADVVQRLTATREPTAADFTYALASLGPSLLSLPPTDAQDGQESEYSSSLMVDSEWGVSELVSVSPYAEPAELVEAAAAIVAPVPVQSASPVVNAEVNRLATLEKLEREVASMVAKHAANMDVDPLVMGMLIQTWPQVLLQAVVDTGERSAHFASYRQVVPEVLALARSRTGVGVHTDADMLIPSVLTRVEAGLVSAGWDAVRIAPVLTAIGHMAPSAIVELQTRQEEVLVSAVGLKMAEPFQLDETVATPAAAPVEPVVVARAASIPETVVDTAMPEKAASGLLLGGSTLQPGGRFAFLSQGAWVVKQLTWANPQATMFLFTADDGASQSITRRMLERLELARAVRPV